MRTMFRFCVFRDVTQVTRHALTRKHATRILRHTDRAGTLQNGCYRAMRHELIL
jgi:hypothetical protein